MLIALRTNNSILLTIQCTQRAVFSNCSVKFLVVKSFIARLLSVLAGCWNVAAMGEVHFYLVYLVLFLP